jgi:hypothetical protein
MNTPPDKRKLVNTREDVEEIRAEAVKGWAVEAPAVVDICDLALKSFAPSTGNALEIERDALAAQVVTLLEELKSARSSTTEAITLPDLLAAIAQVWCEPENSHKEMDATLARGIAVRVHHLYRAQPSARNTILEEAAKVCEGMRTHHPHHENRMKDATLTLAAQKIRALSDGGGA